MKNDVLNRILKEVIENSKTIIMVTNMDGKILFLNDQFEKTTGYKKEEAKGKNPSFLSAKILPPKFYKKLWDTIKKGDVWTGVFINRKKDGTIYHENATITPIKDNKGKIEYFLAIKHEITGRENLIEQTTEDLVEYLPFTVLLLDHTNKIIFSNKASYSMFKKKKNSLIGKDFLKLFNLSKKDKQIPMEKFLKKKEIKTLKDVVVKTNTVALLSNIYLIPIKKQNQQTGNFVLIEDITQKEKSKTMKTQTDIEQMSVILMGLAHDFNNELAISQMLLSSAKMYIESNKKEALAKLNRAIEKIEDLSKLISRIFEKITSPAIKTKTNINTLIKEIIEHFKKQYPNVNFIVKEKDKFIIPVDRDKIHFTISEIIENGVESQEYKGKIEITIENATMEELIQLPVQAGKYVKISIKDYGKGIDRKLLPILFTPYFTTKKRTKEKLTGFSLALCNYNVKKHGGYIDVFSQKNKGTEFSIYLPFKK